MVNKRKTKVGRIIILVEGLDTVVDAVVLTCFYILIYNIFIHKTLYKLDIFCFTELILATVLTHNKHFKAFLKLKLVTVE